MKLILFFSLFLLVQSALAESPIQFFIGYFPRNASFRYQASVIVLGETPFLNDKITIDGLLLDLTEAKSGQRIYGKEYTGSFLESHIFAWKDLAGSEHKVTATLHPIRVRHPYSVEFSHDVNLVLSGWQNSGDILTVTLYRQGKSKIDSNIVSQVLSSPSDKVVVPGAELRKFGRNSSLEIEVGLTHLDIQGLYQVKTLSESTTSRISISR